MRENEKSTVLSRRDLLKGGAALGAGILSAGALAGYGSGILEGAEIPSEGNGLPSENTGSTAIDYERMTGKSAAAAEHYDFKYVNQPGKIGNLTIKNRFVKSASSGGEARFDLEKGEWTPVALEWHKNIARGGTGLIIHDRNGFKPSGFAASGAPLLKDEDIPLHRQIIDIVHNEGSIIFQQFFNADNTSRTPYPAIPDPLPMGSSSFCQLDGTQSMNMISPRVMTTAEVELEIEQWVQGIYMAFKAGYDGAEINAGSNHIICNFVSRMFNRERTDKYSSQSIENLGRIVTDILDGAKKLCGNDFPIGVLMGGREWNMYKEGDNERCNSILLQSQLAKLFENHGADFIHVRSQAWGNHLLDIFPDVAFIHDEPDTGYGRPLDIKKIWPEFIADYRGAGAFLETAGIIKAAVSVPVITTGMMDVRLIPDVIDEYIGSGKIDFIGMARRMYADPDYANKACAGELGEIRPCANCNHCWGDYCRVNVGKQRAGGPEMPEGYYVEKTSTPKKVLIAGGGPAGLEAAHVAAERGHDVTIYEKDNTWGGLVRSAIVYKGRNEKIADHIDWLVRQCEKYGVAMSTGEEVTKVLVEEIKPDVAIIATGGMTTIPDIPGIDHPKVITTGMSNGQKVVVIGAQIEGIEMAIYLRKQGKDVIVLDEGPEENFGMYIPVQIKEKYICWCRTHNIMLYPNIAFNGISDEGITVTYDYGLTETIACDNVVLALPASTDTSLFDEIQGSAPEVYAIGNCNEYGLIREAVLDGNLLARHL